MRRERIGTILRRLNGNSFEIQANGWPRVLEKGAFAGGREDEQRELYRHNLRLMKKVESILQNLRMNKQDNEPYSVEQARWVKSLFQRQ